MVMTAARGYCRKEIGKQEYIKVVWISIREQRWSQELTIADAERHDVGMMQVFVVTLKALPKTLSGASALNGVEWHECSCGRFVLQPHHVDIVELAAKPLHTGSPTESSEIEGCDKALDLALVVYVNHG